MTLVQQVYAQSVLLSGVEESTQGQLLQLFCRSAVTSLTARLRPGMTPEDCRADFIAAAALYALAAFSEVEDFAELCHIQLGDLTVKRNGGAAAKCLRSQAGLIMAPYVKDRFSFRGV